jgi:DNA-binding MarR family transcriptional regulator
MCNYFLIKFSGARKGNQNMGRKSGAEKKHRKKRKKEKESRADGERAAGLPEAQHQAWYQLLRTHATVTKHIEQRLSQAQQIPHHWYDVLVTLEKAPDHRLRMSELAENMVTSRSGLTRLVDRLEEAGFLRRESCPGDGRGAYAVLTEAGAQARLAAWPIVSREIMELFACHLSDEEARTMAEVLRRVADAN